VVPEAEIVAQFPAPALAMTGRVAQAVEVQDPVIPQLPELHLAERVPEYPEAQTGVHVVPSGVLVPQVPARPLVMTGGLGQAVLEQAPVTAQDPELHFAEGVPE
jgi:hypothetical protein